VSGDAALLPGLILFTSAPVPYEATAGPNKYVAKIVQRK
jgi:hypothetical protein